MVDTRNTWARSTSLKTIVTPDGTEIVRALKSDGTVVGIRTGALADADVAAGIAAHVALADPHTQYMEDNTPTLTRLTSLAGTELVRLVQDPDGTPVSRATTINTLLNSVGVVGTRAAVASLSIPTPVAAIRTSGYATAGDGGHALYKRVGAEPSHAGKVADASGAWWELVPDNQGTVDARQFGAVFDGSTNDTTALQNLIDYLEALASSTSGRGAVGRLPRGTTRVSSLTIDKAIALIGADDASTWLYQTAGVDDALIKIRVSHEGSDYYAAGNPPPDVTLQSIRLIGANRASGLTNNHGIDIANAASNSITTSVQLRDVYIREFAGDGIRGTSMTGWVEGANVDIAKCTGYGLNANSCSDWHFYFSDFHECETGMLLSGCGEFQFFGCNRWSNGTYGTYVFNSSGIGNHKFFGGMMDRNGQHGLIVDIRSTAAVVHLFGESILYNGADTDNTYSEIYHAANSTGVVTLNGCTIGRSFSQQTISLERSLYHIQYAGAGGSTKVDEATHFVGLATVTNRDSANAATLSNVYTPTLTINANLDSVTAFQSQWMRVGNVVTVSGRLTADPTAAANTSTSVYVSLPIASNFGAIEDCGGAAACNSVFGLAAAIYADTAGDRAIMQWSSQQTTAVSMIYTFTYRII